VKSELCVALLPCANSGHVELPDDAELFRELRDSSEGAGARGGIGWAKRAERTTTARTPRVASRGYLENHRRSESGAPSSNQAAGATPLHVGGSGRVDWWS